MKKLIKNKYVFLVICVIIISIIYMCVEKMIDNSGGFSLQEENMEENSHDESIVFTDEEIDFKTEEIDEINEETSEEITEVNQIYIHITGEVNNPGVIVLNEGSRIADAINAAGGTTANADVTEINLVHILEEGMKVNIPNKDDLEENSYFEYITKKSGDRGEEESSTDNVNSNVASTERNYVVNINTATQTELETLPGIGPSLALKIINYRKENGKFSSIEEIKKVSGIGEAKFNELRQYITI